MRKEEQNNVHNVAAVILDLKNLEILSMLGNVDFFDKKNDGAVNMATSYRQSGSTLKPFLYALSLESGNSVLDFLKDKKQIFKNGYFPRNFDIFEENGWVRPREALANSYNISAVYLLDKIGVLNFYNFLEDLNLKLRQSVDELGYSMILGSTETSLLNLSQAYAVFPNRGALVDFKFFSRVLGEKGQILFKNDSGDFVGQSVNDKARKASFKSKKQVMSLDSAEWIMHVLSDNSARWKNFSRGNVLELPFVSGAKTGTSQEFRDNWVVGFSPKYVVGVWAGNTNGSPLFAVSGLAGAGPVWRKIMLSLHKDFDQKRFDYLGKRKPCEILRKRGKSEKYLEFLLPDELLVVSQQEGAINKKIEINNQVNFEIFYPKNGDVFFKGSDLLIQVRGEFDKNDIQYFLNDKKLENLILKNLKIGQYELKVLLNNIVVAEVYFTVEI